MQDRLEARAISHKDISPSVPSHVAVLDSDKAVFHAHVKAAICIVSIFVALLLGYYFLLYRKPHGGSVRRRVDSDSAVGAPLLSPGDGFIPEDEAHSSAFSRALCNPES